MTSHPKDLTDGVIAAMAESTKVPHNIHLPVQSGSDKVLRDMNRRYTRERYFSLIGKLRARHRHHDGRHGGLPDGDGGGLS